MSNVAQRVIADRFEIERVAGRGGMGTVFRARDRETEQPVALKIVEGDFANARFEREAKLLATLEDAAIVRYVAHGVLDSGARPRMFLAMEWLEGTPLDARLEEGSLPVPEAIAIAARVARALASAHDIGVIHRDVKPSNVILRDGRAEGATLVDFGIARARNATQAMTATGAVIGTPAYMAPEQARGERLVDGRADLFSLGCVLFECLCGRPAFVGEHVVAVLAKILLEPAPRLRSLREDIPSTLDVLVASMLEKTPDARPPTGAAVIASLEAIDRAAPSQRVRPETPGIGERERRLASVLIVHPRRPPPVSSNVGMDDTEHMLAGLTTEDTLAARALQHGVTLHALANGASVGVLFAPGGAHETAVRVVRCARALEADLAGGVVAVATGRAVLAGDVPVGEAIDAAARLLSGAAPGDLWICRNTASMVETNFEVTARDGGAVVGRERVDGEIERTVLGKKTPCVGRDRELSLLEATFRECAEEPVGRAMLVVSPPGVGKSRLQRELVARVRAAATRPAIWMGVADPQMERAPFALLGDLLRRVLGLAGGGSVEARRDVLISRLGGLDTGSRGRVAQFLGEIAGAPFDDSTDEALRAARRNPALLGDHVRDAFVSFAVAELARGPLLVVLEDVHWADAASLKLFGALLSHAADLPLMVLALARPTLDDAHPRLWHEQRCQRIILEPLLRKAAEKLARAVLGDRAEVDAIVQRAAGNALFVEELARACVEGRASTDLPPTIAAVTEGRFSSLPAEARQVLRAGAVFGERFWRNAVETLLGAEARARLDESLALLVRLELVSDERESRFAGEHAYLFRHALVRDAAYAMLTDEDRALGHALAAAWLETRVDDGALLAHHYDSGGRPAEAAPWYVRAAEQALVAHDFDALFRHASRAEACGASGDVLGRVRLAQAEARLWIGENAHAATAAREAVALLPHAAEKWFLALGIAVAATGKLTQIDALLELVDELERTPATDERSGRARAIARARAAGQLAWCGELARADALLDGCEAEPGAADDSGALAWIADAHGERGHAAGIPVHPSVPRRGRELFMKAGDRRGALGQLASELQLLGSIGASDELEQLATALSRDAGGESRAMSFYVALTRAAIRAEAGDVDELLAFTEMLGTSSNPRSAGAARMISARALAAAGRHDEARTHAERAVALSAAVPSNRAGALAVLARIAVATGDAAAAASISQAALEAGAHGTLAAFVATLQLARVEALAASGRDGDALEALRAGVAAMDRAAANLGEYKDTFFRSHDARALFALARARGVHVA